jgi:hypothetical protein
MHAEPDLYLLLQFLRACIVLYALGVEANHLSLKERKWAAADDGYLDLTAVVIS